MKTLAATASPAELSGLMVKVALSWCSVSFGVTMILNSPAAAPGSTFVANSGADEVTTTIDVDEDLVALYSPLHRGQALQFVREGVSNAIRHGRPKHLSVSWQLEGNGSLVLIIDDGVGFDPQANASAGRGLGNLRERAVNLGGTLAISSSPSKGTKLSLNLPSPEGSI